jgi:hypothetical protein
MYRDRLHAVSDGDDSITIKAAIDSLPAPTKRLMASAGVDLAGKRIKICDLDRAIRASGLTDPVDRIALKLGLDKAGLLATA